MAESYIVVGPYFRFQTGDPQYGFGTTLMANGSSIGPQCVATTLGGESGAYGAVSGSINGSTIEFTITWDHHPGPAVHTGTVGPDGVPRGTANAGSRRPERHTSRAGQVGTTGLSIWALRSPVISVLDLNSRA
ncbi:hypothetical protein [Streptomyces sp. NPDC001165]|uniref:hypothetical protein n=1 Tax=Streptomyces sp. NPDC001165 TaxID=3364546 RepID=UPI0036CB2AB5